MIELAPKTLWLKPRPGYVYPYNWSEPIAGSGLTDGDCHEIEFIQYSEHKAEVDKLKQKIKELEEINKKFDSITSQFYSNYI